MKTCNKNDLNLVSENESFGAAGMTETVKELASKFQNCFFF